MWGAVIGDMAGSIYEFKQHEKASLLSIDELITEDSFFSDDTILTIAIYEAILNRGSYGYFLREYGKRYMNYCPKTRITERFHTVFGKGFEDWVNGKNNGSSIGNGAMMRISGVGKMFNTEQEVITQSMLATKPSHNTSEAINCAQIIALIIFYARHGLNKIQIMQKLGITAVSYKPFTRFNKTCYETIDNCLYAFFTSNNFEDALRIVLSMGGDTDTNAAIVGSMAEALYGVPEYYINVARKKIPPRFSYILDKAYAQK